MLDRKGLEGLPLKLLIVSLLMSISVPVVLENLAEYGRKVDLAALKSEASEIKRVAQTVFEAGPGNSRILSIDLPTSSSISLGGVDGSDSFSIGCFYHKEKVATEWLDSAFHLVCRDGTLRVSGHCRLILSSIQTNEGVEVRVEVIP